MAMDERIAARLRAARVSAVGALVEAEEACVVGTVVAGKVGTRVLTSPGAGMACVAYWFRDDAGMEEARGVAFALDDGTGSAWIDASRAILVGEDRDEPGLHRSIVGAKFLAAHGHPGRHVERVVPVGDRVYVLGACTREADRAGEATYREAPRTRLRFSGTAERPLLIVAAATFDATSA